MKRCENLITLLNQSMNSINHFNDLHANISLKRGHFVNILGKTYFQVDVGLIFKINVILYHSILEYW